MANGVKFGSYHSSTDLSLFLISKSIGVPQVKGTFISIPAGDGSIDLTECFGEVKYENRELEFKFAKVGGDFQAVFTDVQNKLHGREMQITLDSDPNYYYKGRVYVKEWNANATTGEIGISCTCEPYKYKNTVTQQVENVTTTKDVVITNGRKTAYPKITTTAAFSIVKGGVTYSYGVVSNYQTTIPLNWGDNALTLNGTGTITFDWQEGAI